MNWQALDAAGITSCFNATPQTDNWPADFKARTPYLRLNQDDGAAIPPEKLDQFAAWLFVQAASADSAAPLALLVHCGAGVSRASAFGALAEMLLAQLEWAIAVGQIRAVRPQVAPHPALVSSIRDWWLARQGREWAVRGITQDGHTRWDDGTVL